MNLLWCGLVLFPVWAAQPDADAIRASQADALAKQKAAARLQAQVQVESPTAGDDDFFVLPFPPLAGVTPGAQSAQSCLPAPESAVKAMLGAAARREGLDPVLLETVARTESGLDSCAVSGAGAEGVMQLMPETQASFAVTNPLDPAQSIAAGAKFLKQLLGKYGGNWSLALAAYNAGPARVDPSGPIPAIPETRRYIEKILGSQRQSAGNEQLRNLED